ncbi:hypothetical protein [Actinosynnema mirum]|uniref:DNA binding domain protein, excisionase family n=1 Tax=Actinosynnema mirum (strain ATCC 29888 / DSM 43827 / JCM 3225 / NBRC 14064 / NCIMB 13271 / NRRL B-12336 / IMRU 3971 / 101) TaxID=446462 RepID=C6WC32_ACTMD|nr:hypothetical protein [Actinosynnema mirum]ACU39420.1 hypothetical protein Amir_5604 [Actinosynnema mirum DSM 43827]
MSPPDEHEMRISSVQLAREAGVVSSTICRAIQRGEIDAIRVGKGRGTYRITRSEADRYIARCRDAVRT